MSHGNNFDLIRLVAATQVAIVHVMTHLGLGDGLTHRILHAFPGVPVFFFVSGFLVSASLARSPSLGAYARARALRLFPGLWVATSLSVLSVALSGYLSSAEVDWRVFSLWLLGQATFVQFFNPDFLRDYGTGVLNGSLWTISVELQFYLILLPFAFLLARARRLAAATAAFAVLVGAGCTVLMGGPLGGTLVGKLLFVSFLPWLWMFLLGVLAQAYWPRIRPLVEGRVLVWLVLYVAAVLADALLRDRLGPWAGGNKSSILLFWPLAGLILSAAFTAPGLAERLLRGQDLSYGLYLYHMPVVNLLLYLNGLSGVWGAIACLALSLLLAAASWRLVERPALRLKVSSRTADRTSGLDAQAQRALPSGRASHAGFRGWGALRR